MTKPLAEILEDLHDLSEELRPHIEQDGAELEAALLAKDGAEAELSAVTLERDLHLDWRRKVAKELGWIEDLEEPIPDAEFMADVARIHGESHRRRVQVEEDLSAYRAQHRELRAAVDRRDATIKRLTDNLEKYNHALVELAQAKASRRRAEQRYEEIHVAASRLAGLLNRWVDAPCEGCPGGSGGDPDLAAELEAETTAALKELEAQGPAPGTPVPCNGKEDADGQ